MRWEFTFFFVALLLCLTFYFMLGYKYNITVHSIQRQTNQQSQYTYHLLNVMDMNESTESYDAEQDVDGSEDHLIVPPWDKIISNHHWDVKKLHEYDLDEGKLESICKSTYWNALQRTIYYSYIDNTTFVITGDIEDMWIRDSTEQIWPYFALIHEYEYIRRMIYGAIIKQAQLITAEIYTNAFRKEAYCYDKELQILIKTSIVATRDDEIDSGAYFIKLLYKYYSVTRDQSILNDEVKGAIVHLLNMWQIEQYHNKYSQYKGNKTVTHAQELRISESLDGIGMIWTSHRPSDDLCQYPYHIPDNLFVHQSLSLIKVFAQHIWHNKTMHRIAHKLQNQIYFGIHAYGVTHDDIFGDIYCYEVDGLGHCNLMDDANIPSLLSIPMISNAYNRSIYRNTRRWVLSEHNPYYFTSKSNKVKGIGSPHTNKRYIWPLALITQGFTARNDNEKYQMLQMLYQNTGHTKLMHESFLVDKDTKFTRKFFSWANSFFSVYAQCIEQFMDPKQIDEVIQMKIKSDHLIGSLSSIREPITNAIHQSNPKYIQWLKKCEKKGANKYIDDDREQYKTIVFSN